MKRPTRLPTGRTGLLVVVFASLLVVAAVAGWRRSDVERVVWSDTFRTAQRVATVQHKGMLLDFTATWCPACDDLRRTTWSDRSVAAAVAERFVPVRVDVDAQPDLAQRYDAEFLPTLVLTDADGRELRRSVGYLSPDDFHKWLDGGPGGV
jgi:thiol:disulfide interchange protein DsbD